MTVGGFLLLRFVSSFILSLSSLSSNQSNTSMEIGAPLRLSISGHHRFRPPELHARRCKLASVLCSSTTAGVGQISSSENCLATVTIRPSTSTVAALPPPSPTPFTWPDLFHPSPALNPRRRAAPAHPPSSSTASVNHQNCPNCNRPPFPFIGSVTVASSRFRPDLANPAWPGGPGLSRRRSQPSTSSNTLATEGENPSRKLKGKTLATEGENPSHCRWVWDLGGRTEKGCTPPRHRNTKRKKGGYHCSILWGGGLSPRYPKSGITALDRPLWVGSLMANLPLREVPVKSHPEHRAHAPSSVLKRSERIKTTNWQYQNDPVRHRAQKNWHRRICSLLFRSCTYLSLFKIADVKAIINTGRVCRNTYGGFRRILELRVRDPTYVYGLPL